MEYVTYVLLCTLREILYLLSSIAVIVICFLPLKGINNFLYELPVKTDFNITNQVVYEGNKLHFQKMEFFINENSIINNNNNDGDIYINFFEKYNLKEGDKFSLETKIDSPLSKIYSVNLAFIILGIILIIPSIIHFIYITKCDNIYENEDGDNGVIFYFTQFFTGVRFVAVLILFCIHITSLIKYKNEFENDFFDLYNNSISNENEKQLFKNYYNDIFELKDSLILNTGMLGGLLGFTFLLGIIPFIILLISAYCCHASF